ncbi:MAG TPA: hypoxanthine phosphoribosyltransferase [Anaerolineaceae bacterium]|jgi:hypoxanthine phosphoribosyltransferase|nr:hypoxanthine phosphoribosyltransferase [Anaerolineaceae bacterium]
MSDLSDYGALGQDIKEIVISEAQIQARIKELGAQISLDYTGRDPLLVGVLRGVVFFMADLLRAITIPVSLDFLAVSRYQERTGGVRLLKDLDFPIAGRHVLFVEDLIDTGLTLSYLLRNLRERQPASLAVCALFSKTENRLIDFPVQYKGFDLPDRFVVGYGLDHHERYRNLPFIGLLKPSAL